MKKNQQFFVFKLSSSRIKKANYNVELSISQARKNAELISISQNQVILSVFKIKGKLFDKSYLDVLIQNRRDIRKLESCTENIEELINIQTTIDGILFVPDIVSLTVDSKSQYKKIIKKGFKINGVEFTRLLCGAGHSRRNTVIFCSKHIEKELKRMLNNGRRLDDIVLAKNNAYFALSYSGTIPVSDPYFCVVQDCEIKKDTKVEFIDDNNEVSVKEMELSGNIFDGMGLVSPKMAKKWAKDLRLDYIPSSFLIRSSFLKGLVCVFDFHMYSEEVAEKHIFKDAWGNSVNIRDMDLILTTSQFKAWQNYDSLQEYQRNCKENDFHFGVVRVAPETDKTSVTTNYQFLQALDLDDEQIELLCEKTVEYFDKTVNSDWTFAALYLMGSLADVDNNDNLFNSINDTVTKAIILNNSLIQDPHVKNYLIKSLNKKIKESYVGSLIVNGNYSFIVADPVAFCEYIFDKPIKGLLDEWQHYSGFWNKRNVSKVAAMRAPLTWRSEVNVLNLVDNDETDKWYKHLQNGCTIYDVHGTDMMLHADADFDGDLIATTDQQQIIEGAFRGLPITYSRETAKKEPIIENNLWKIDTLGFNSKIGFITNISTTLFAMQASYDVGSHEFIEIEKRLKLCRKLQGLNIDHAKGLEVVPLPKYWTKYITADNDNMSEEIDLCNFNNSIRINQRPYFFRYRYQNYNKRYKNYQKTYENFCQTNYGKSLEEMLDSPQTEQEKEVVEKYHRYSPLLDSPCAMNKVCRFMEKSVKVIKFDMRARSKKFNISLLKTSKYEFDEQKFKKLYKLYEEFKTGKRNFANIKNNSGERSYRTLQHYNIYIRNKATKISNNMQELANLAVEICYVKHPGDGKNFLWSIFEDGLLANITENKQKENFIPLVSDTGDIDYLGKKYSLQKIDVEKN